MSESVTLLFDQFNAGERAFLNNLPRSSGVYLMKDQEAKVVYIGKAKDLKVRLSSYFFGRDDRYQIKFLMQRVYQIQTIVTETEEQSLILERDLINKYKPRYNIRLKDDKNYLSIRVDTNAEWPRVELVRRVENDGAKYFGPYSYSYEVRELTELIHQTIPLRTCTDTVFHNRQRPCLEYQIKRCAGPCCLAVDPDQYSDWVKQATSLLNGQIQPIVKQLETQMEQSSQNLFFEDAAIARDRIEILKKFKQGQKYISSGTENRDIFALYREESLAVVAVMQVRSGRIAYNNNYPFELVDLPDEDLMQSVIEQYYLAGRDVPEEVVCNILPLSPDFIQNHLKIITGHKVPITEPQKGLKFRLVSLAMLNAQKYFELRFNSEVEYQNLAEELTKLCKLKQVPRRIECLDISNLQGSDIVGAIVSFYDGKPDKQNYRKYKISFQDQPNDFAAVKEVVKRRMQAAMENADFPDLLIIDGGQIQLRYAMEALEELKISQEIISLAKERTTEVRKFRVNKPERIYLPYANVPLELSAERKLTKLIAGIRDEVHRFVITFHRSQRAKRVFSSALDNIPGIGLKRKTLLLKAFGSIEEIKNASIEEVAQTGRMNLQLAETLLQKLR